jgi:hypothetical protein
MKFSVAFALAASLIAASSVGARAASVTDAISFTDTAFYSVVQGSPEYDGAAQVSGSFDITFDPSKVYGTAPGYTPPNPAAITDFSLTVTNPAIAGLSAAAFGNAYTWSYAYGTLQLNSSGNTDPGALVPDQLVIRINGWGDTPAADTWYAVTGHPILTSSGGASISPVPLPAALPLFGAALSGLGFYGWRLRRRTAAV